MLGVKNHFDISGRIEIREVDIAGVACIKLQLHVHCSSPCNYIGGIMILSWFYDPSSEDSYLAGHSLSFSV